MQATGAGGRSVVRQAGSEAKRSYRSQKEQTGAEVKGQAEVGAGGEQRIVRTSRVWYW